LTKYTYGKRKEKKDCICTANMEKEKGFWRGYKFIGKIQKNTSEEDAEYSLNIIK
jgi:hypothetical protein